VTQLEQSLNLLLVETFRNILAYEEKSLRGMLGGPVTIREAHIIEAIGEAQGDVSVSQIAASQEIAVPTATVAIQKLEAKGYLRRIPSKKDARITLVTLTESGARVCRAHRLFHQKLVHSMTLEFSEEEEGVLYRAVEKLNGFFRSRIEA